MLLSRIAIEIQRMECLDRRMEKLRKRISSHAVFPAREDWSLMGLFTGPLHWTAIKEEEDRLAKELSKEQQKDRQYYQRSLDVFAQEPSLVAAQLRHLGQQVKTMRGQPGGTEAAIIQREREWVRLVRHADGVLWHVEEAAGYAAEIRACHDGSERACLAAELKWLIDSHADTIEWHFVRGKPWPDEEERWG
ncbi:hypothetical protein PG985_000229 [Apiospora marii]|uniref:uncharacterized protein n=1 Tax=Apiospora marii TaxID=335849 RepID=UPI0031303FF7